MQRKGYEAYSADSWPMAVGILKTQSIDVVILEHGFAKDDGISLVQGIKVIDPHVVIIVLTSQPDIEKIIRIMRWDGAFDVLIKPLERIEALLESVNNAVLQRQRLSRHQQKLTDLMQANCDLREKLAQESFSHLT
jgi:DNA-binding NtrC family response regulator